MVRAGWVALDVPETQVQRDEEATFALGGLPDPPRRPSLEPFVVDRVNVVTEPTQVVDAAPWEVLVELEPHRRAGFSSGTGRSSCAEVAANAMAARTSSTDRDG